MKNHLIILTLIIVQSTFAQSGWNWCEPVNKTKEKAALFYENVKEDNFLNAKPFLDDLLQNCPKLHVSLYNKGIKVYKGLIESTTDNTLKKQYQGQVLELYDKQVEYFGSEAKVLNKKAYDAYNYLKNSRESYHELLELFDRTFRLNREAVYNRNLVAYMDVIRRYQMTNKDLTDQEILKRYKFIVDIGYLKIKNSSESASKVSRLYKDLEVIDKMLLTLVNLSCDAVTEIYGKKLKETKDLNLAKKVFKLILNGKCSNNPLAIEAGNIILEEEPSLELCKFLATRAVAIREYDKAIELYNKAANLTHDYNIKYQMYISIAKLMVKKGEKGEARAYALAARAVSPLNSEPYILIGDLYMKSYSECSQGQSQVMGKAVFIAAYDMYELADYSNGMRMAKEKFPTDEEIFNESRRVGEQILIECWINRKVTLKSR